MAEVDFLEGKTKVRRLNNHDVVVVVPSKRISYEEGSRKLDEMFAKIRKRKR